MSLVGLRHCAVLLLASAFVAGCGGGSAGPDLGVQAPIVVAAPIGDPVAQTIGASGGTVEATASGVKVRLSFPPGALAVDTTITVTPQAPSAGDVASVKLAPGGVLFAQPVTVVLEYPAGQAPSAKASLRQQFGGGDSYIVTTVDIAAGTLTAKLPTFGGAALDVLARPAAASAARAHSLSAKAMDTSPAPTDGSLTAAATTPIADIVASVKHQVLILENAEDFDSAFSLLAGIASVLNRRDDADYPLVALPFLRDAHDTACHALSAAISNSRTATITTSSDYKSLRVKLGDWWVVADETNVDGSGCPGATIEDFIQAGKDLLAREEAFLKAKFKGAAKAVDYSEPSTEVKDARRNKLEVEALETLQTTMALPDLPQSAGRSRAANAGPLSVHVSGFAALIQTDLLDPVMTPAREAAWATAKSNASLAQYPVLLDAFGSAPLLQQDVQFVLTRISARSIDSGGNTLVSSTLGFEVVPALPADPKRSDSITLRPDGTLALSGNIANLECADVGVETLTVTFEGVQVASVSGSGGNLLAGALGTLTPATLLSAAGLHADDTSSHTLLIRRSVSPCAATLGLTDDLLATVTVRLGAPPRLAFVATPLIDPDHHADQWILQAVDASGGALTTLLVGAQAGCAGCPGDPAGPASWSPDGRRLVYVGYTPATGASALWIANADGSGATLVPGTGGATSPHWMPDGKKFVFASAGNIMSINIDGTSPLALTSGGTDSGPVLSGNGKRILFLRLLDPATGTGGYFVMNADGSGLSALVLPPKFDTPAMSPDGTQVAFVSYTDVKWQIMVANVDGSGQREVYSISSQNIPAGEAEPRVLQGPVSWSPEGNQIAFMMYRVLIVGTPDDITWNWLCATDSIWLVKSDGSGPKEVMHGDSTLTYGLPAWSQ